jgi:peptide/nickel transport system permease protein
MTPAWSRSRRAGAWLLAVFAAVSVLAPVLAPNSPTESFADRDRAYAPPTRIRIVGQEGLRRPFIYHQVLEDRLARQFRDDTSRPLPIRWFRSGRLMSVEDGAGPLLLLGADDLGRDTFSRLLYGARLSLGVTFAGVLGALMLGGLAGGLAGGLGGRVEAGIMLVADFVIVLPGAYLVMVLVGLLPRQPGTPEVFTLMALLFAVAGAPHVARGVRSIVATERSRDYAEAARAAGAGPLRLVRHLLPAAHGFMGVQMVLLVPALLVAEVTVSFLGFGFGSPTASWGTMLQAMERTVVIREAPWMLAPAAALFAVVLAVQLVAGTQGTANALHLGDRSTR